MTSFLYERGRHYMQNISSQRPVRHIAVVCRHFSFSNLSIRQVFQASLNQQEFRWKRIWPPLEAV